MKALGSIALAASLLVSLATLSMTDSARATPLSPGPGAFPPDVFTFTCPGAMCPTLLASETTSWTNTTGTISGDFMAAVYSDPQTGGLDFMYQVTNSPSSTDSIGRITMTNFTTFNTDVGFTPDGGTLGFPFADGTIAPELVDRTLASTIGFSFNTPLTTLIAPGQTSNVLVIETNATTFINGEDANIIDGGVTTVAAFAPRPTTGVPEPLTLSLFGAGLIGAAAMRRRKAKA